ncbi:hypothetical protein HS088_TW02G00728 [Tripterygium wilfordii]|uniref:Senescence regulator n=1 Tax=Tripterygium wilfordii TaxID=458696 RepID=A0A7J7DZK8_TRIWF|nr:uncharacterized protein LOC120006332 [Tripterygium wilfordii]KAF5751711.1 hypothetical protein HS088_TW02G00728 [Tripterygium wilfordii]
MDSNGMTRFCHRQSPSSDRFLGAFTHSPPSEYPSTSTTSIYDFNELSEDDIFFSPDFSSSARTDHRNNRTPVSSSSPSPRHHSKNFPQPESFGILAALAEHEPFLKLKTFQKASISASASASSSVSSSSTSSSRLIPSIPKPPQDRLPALSSSAKFHQHQSAPVNVPVFARVKSKQKEFDDIDDEEEEEEGGEMLPPHEIVAMGSARSPFLACSVLEGVGRTLKGRDLRQVRNAVWRQTGFLD